MGSDNRAYVGWVRALTEGRPGKWVQVCEVAGYWACWDELLKERGAKQCEKVVLVEGKLPGRVQK